MIRLDLTVPGNPVTKGRPRFSKTGHAYTPKETRDAEDLLAWIIRGNLFPKDPPEGQWRVDVDFYTKDARRTDIDNLLKMALDSMTKAGVWRDDSDVVEIHTRLFRSDPHPRTYVRVTDY